jgi:hypothetical protein
VNIIDSLGLDITNIDDSDLIASAMLLVRVIQEDGREYVGHYSSDGLSLVEKVGMLRLAERITLAQFADVPDGDDD